MAPPSSIRQALRPRNPVEEQPDVAWIVHEGRRHDFDGLGREGAVAGEDGVRLVPLPELAQA
ncbi:MAG: hypothetical protein ACR2FH_04960, partial [Caulobacteraceae bacterium]